MGITHEPVMAVWERFRDSPSTNPPAAKCAGHDAVAPCEIGSNTKIRCQASHGRTREGGPRYGALTPFTVLSKRPMRSDSHRKLRMIGPAHTARASRYVFPNACRRILATSSVPGSGSLVPNRLGGGRVQVSVGTGGAGKTTWWARPSLCPPERIRPPARITQQRCRNAWPCCQARHGSRSSHR